jgi:hypothetical protein
MARHGSGPDSSIAATGDCFNASRNQFASSKNRWRYERTTGDGGAELIW